MEIPFIDIHTHKLYFEKNVISVLNIGFKNQFIPNQLFSYGIHPWDLTMDENKTKELLEDYYQNKNMRIIGEAGLDKIHGPDLELQKKVFEVHIDLAEKYHLPLIIHCVKSYNEILKMLERTSSIPTVIFHGFDKKLSVTKEIIKKGYSISLGESLFKKPEIMKELLQTIPHNFIFFETDESYYTIQEIYVQASILSGHSVQYWKKSVFSNYQNLGNE